MKNKDIQTADKKIVRTQSECTEAIFTPFFTKLLNEQSLAIINAVYCTEHVP